MTKNINKKYLFINTADNNLVQLILLDNDGQKICSSKFSCQYQFQIKDKLLVMINKILNKKQLSLQDLCGIIVFDRSAQMTSLRIGVATANALAYSLNIPVAGINNIDNVSLVVKNFNKNLKFKPVLPEYEKNPMLDKKTKS